MDRESFFCDSAGLCCEDCLNCDYDPFTGEDYCALDGLYVDPDRPACRDFK